MAMDKQGYKPVDRPCRYTMGEFKDTPDAAGDVIAVGSC